MLNRKRGMMKKSILLISSLAFLSLFISIVSAASDVSVFQGQYYIGEELQQGTFEFNFAIYDGETGGNLTYSDTQNLSTGFWGQWRTELSGISSASNDTTKDYFMEITIDGNVQSPRRRLTHFNYLRKDVDEETSGDISSSGRIGAEEYTYVPSEGTSILDSFFNFVSPSGGNLIRISPREDFLGFSNTTSIFVISDNESYVGMTHFISPISGLPNSWLWADIHNGNGGFALIDTENLSVGKEYIVKGAFSDGGFSLGGVSNNPQGENSAGSDFKIYSDANGTTAFFVDSANSYATTIDALLNVTDTAYFDDAYINGIRICLEDGTNCQIQNISFSENDTLQTTTDRGSTTTNNMTIGSVLNFVFGGYIQEFADRFFVSKDLEVDGNVTADYYLGDGSYLTGIIGQPGANGSQGIQGIPGVNGTNGIDGVNGSQGIQGIQGIQGEAGINGTDGDTWFSLISGWLSYNGNLFIDGNINASGNITSGGKLVCLEDGTNCQVISFTDTNCSVGGSCGLITYDSELNYTIDTDTSASVDCEGDQVLLGNGSCISSASFGGGSSIQYVSFISTVDGKLNKNDRYLALGTDGGISGSVTEMAWIIDRDMTITGILWDSKSNSRTKTSAITLMSGSNKNSLSDTSLSKNIQGVVSGSDLTFSVSLSQGDAVAIKYDSGGNGGDIEELSITLIGTYD